MTAVSEPLLRVRFLCAKLLRKSSCFPEDSLRSEHPGARDQWLYRFDRFCLNPLDRRLSFDEAAVAIPPKAFDALVALVANAGRLMGKQELHQHLWPDTFVGDVTLARNISDLRRILATHSTSTFIATVPRHGYRFVAQVTCSPLEVVGPQLAPASAAETDASQLVMRAWYTIRRWSPDAVTEALTYARRAITIDPCNADAHAVSAYIYLYAGFGLLPGKDAFPRAKPAATTALSLNPACAPAHAVLAMQRLVFERDMAGAEESCRTAIQLAPNGMPGHFAYSHLLLIRGRFREALEEALVAMDADPLSSPVAYQVANVLYYSGCDEEAVTQLLKFDYLDPEFLPAHQLLAILHARMGRPQGALSEAKKVLELSGQNARAKATLAIVSALLGNHAEARAILRELEEDSAVPGFRWSYARAIIHVHLGEGNSALQCLSQACEEAGGALLYLRYDPHFSGIRDDERFKEILDRIRI